MMDTLKGFFELTEDNKLDYADTHVMNPIRYGTSFNPKVDDVKYWRDYLKLNTHPEFHCPTSPPEFREILQEYTRSTRELARKLLGGIWESLGVDEKYMIEALNLDSCFQIAIGNLYRPCPQPELATGLPPHSDHGLLTILYQNEVDGLELKHNGKWVSVKPLPESYLINTGDHMEIVSNGKYKSVLHRAVADRRSTSMSIAAVASPSFDTVVPVQQLLSNENPATFRGMKCGEFLEYQRSNRVPGLIHLSSANSKFLMASQVLSGSCNLSSFSSNDSQATNLELVVEDAEVPVVDFSLLTGGNPDQRSQAVENLRRACEEWGFFVLVNHGVPERLRKAIIETFKGFFDLPVVEKKDYADTHVMNTIRYGSGFNAKMDDVKFSRDYLKIITHPEFNSPSVPPEFREILQEYAKCTRELARRLLGGIWESLGVDEKYMNEALILNSCFQLVTGNHYPPCPQAELAVGLPPHSDHGFLTILFQNDVDGLEVKHNGKWVRIKPLPNSYLINTADHMEIVSNGKYKSVLHRAVVNERNTRMSIAATVSSSWDTVVVPAPQLVSSTNPAAFRGMKYGEFVEYQQSNSLKEKSVLDLLRL